MDRPEITEWKMGTGWIMIAATQLLIRILSGNSCGSGP